MTKHINIGKSYSETSDHSPKDFDDIEIPDSPNIKIGSTKKSENKFFSYNCPHCGSRFTNEDVDRAKAGKAYFILNKHGMSIRSIGRLFDMHPESVRYHMKKFEKMAKMPPVAIDVFEQEYPND